jgi:hypothetical protein
MIKRLKEKWGVESNLQFWTIILVFTLTGSSITFIRKPVFELLGIGDHSAWWVWWGTWLLIVYPSYQILLIIYGSILGQFKFFWAFEKKMLRRFGFKNL